MKHRFNDFVQNLTEESLITPTEDFPSVREAIEKFLLPQLERQSKQRTQKEASPKMSNQATSSR